MILGRLEERRVGGCSGEGFNVVVTNVGVRILQLTKALGN